MAIHLFLLLLLSLQLHVCQTRASPDFPTVLNVTSPLTLAVQPACGPLNSTNFTEINTGIKLTATRYAYFFFRCLANLGKNQGPLLPLGIPGHQTEVRTIFAPVFQASF